MKNGIQISEATAKFIRERLEAERKNLKASLAHPQVEVNPKRLAWLANLDMAIADIDLGIEEAHGDIYS